MTGLILSVDPGFPPGSTACSAGVYHATHVGLPGYRRGRPLANATSTNHRAPGGVSRIRFPDWSRRDAALSSRRREHRSAFSASRSARYGTDSGNSGFCRSASAPYGDFQRLPPPWNWWNTFWQPWRGCRLITAWSRLMRRKLPVRMVLAWDLSNRCWRRKSSINPQPGTFW